MIIVIITKDKITLMIAGIHYTFKIDYISEY